MVTANIRERTARRRRERDSATLRPGPATKNSAAAILALAFLLSVCTFFLYLPVRGHDFVNYDDNTYVYENPHVTAGLSWKTLRWSVTATEQANWHPVTWLSHAFDCQLFQLDAGYHHIMSMLIHAVNVFLLFLLLQQATGTVGRSFFVAGLFAWHPFNVQSVAWVAERKNVLSTLFVLLAIAAYGWYSRSPRARRFLPVVILFALALAAKPMAVTLPCLLLLLDYWPLQRVAGWSEPSPRLASPQLPIASLLLEKWPLFILSGASCAITVWAQKQGGSVRSLHAYPLALRLCNAIYSYGMYLWKMFWPAHFAVFYPHPGTALAWWKPAGALVLILAISWGVWKQRSARPYLPVGWLWFLGALVPVIGIVQVGDQAMADRYAYLPLLGLFVIVAWGAGDLFSFRRVKPSLQWATAAAVLGIVSLLTFRELDYWQDSVTLWSRALEVTSDNLTAEQGVASALNRRGDGDLAVPHFLNVIRLNPVDLPSRINIGVNYASHGRMQDATREFEDVVQLTDHGSLSSDDRRWRSSAQLNIGLAYVLAWDFPNALAIFQRANRSDASMADQVVSNLEKRLAVNPAEDGYVQLALLLQAKGEKEEAASIVENASRENPGYVHFRDLLNYLNSNPR